MSSKLNKFFLGRTPLSEEPEKALNLTIKDSAITSAKIAEGAITNDKIEDGSISYNKLNEALKALVNGKGDLPADLEQTIQHILEEQLPSYLQPIERRVGSLETIGRAFLERVSALEERVFPPASNSWYIGQCSKSDPTNFTNMTAQELLSCSTKFPLDTTRVDSIILNSSYWFFMVPSSVTSITAAFGSGSLVSRFTWEQIQQWQEDNFHPSIKVDGETYEIYAYYMYDLEGSGNESVVEITVDNNVNIS